jgi:outer membrane protein with beta-barrel domain
MIRKTMYATFCFLASLAIAQAQSEPPRFSFEFGGGFNKPVGNLENRLDTGWNLNTGGGINLTPHLGLMGQFMFTDSGLTRSYLSSLGEPDGSFRMWGLTADPVVRFNPRGRMDFYLIGGGGIYRRTVEFTRPTTATVTVFDPFFDLFYPAGVPANQVIGSLSTTRPGVNGGGGFSFRLGDGNAKLFVETRYHRMFTKGMSTSVLPVTLGFRW